MCLNVIERPANLSGNTTARPGVVIGKKGEDVENYVKQKLRIAGVPAQINISEVRKPVEPDAQPVADGTGHNQSVVLCSVAL